MAGIDWSTWITPTLAANPGAAVDVSNSTDPQATAGPVSHAINLTSTQDGINDHAVGTGTQSFWAKIGNFTSNTLSALNKPLQEIQKDYKFLHSVYTDHSAWQGFLATMGAVGGGIGGFALAGPLGARAGIDLALYGERSLAKDLPQFKNSIAKSEDPNYKISAGRDFTNALGVAAQQIGWDSASKALKSTDKGLFGSVGSFVSGVVDATGDVSQDPIMVIGAFGQAMRGGKLLKLDKAGEIQLKYPIMDTVPGVKNFLTANSGFVLSAEAPIVSQQLDAVRTGIDVFGKNISTASRTYNRAIDDIASISANAKNSASAAGEIATKYPQLGTAAAGRLGELKTADEVHNFMKSSLYFGELNGTLAGKAMLPSRTLLRAKLGDSIIEKLQSLPSGATKTIQVAAEDGSLVNQKVLKTIPERLASLPGNLYNTFTGYMPYSVDAESQKLSLTKFKWDAPDSASVIYRIGKMGLGEEGAKEMAGKYAEAVATNDRELARIIKNQTYFETLKGLGLPESDAFVKKAYEEMNKVGEPLVSDQVYFTDPLGNPGGDYIAKNGNFKVGGIGEHQATDMFDIPDFLQIRRAMKEYGLLMKGYNKINEGLDGTLDKLLYNKEDEFIVDRYTNKIFKPLALATAGFGLRVSVAELIPAISRYGLTNMFKAKLATAAAKANVDMIPGEAKHVFSATLTALGIHMGLPAEFMTSGFPAYYYAKRKGLNFAASLTAPQQLEHATMLVLANEGHVISEATAPGHGMEASNAYQAGQMANYYHQIQKNSALYKDLPEWTTYTTADTHYVPRLTTNLNQAAKQAFHKNIAQDFLDAAGSTKKFQIEEDYDKLAQHDQYQAIRQDLINKETQRIKDTLAGNYKPYNSESKRITRWRDQEPQAFATHRVDATLGMMIGKDGTFLKKIAENVANGESTDLNMLAEMAKTTPRSMPAATAGPVMQPYMGGNTISDKVANAANYGFKKWMDPIVKGLSREPLYLVHFSEAMGRYEPLISKGLMSEDQAIRHAQTQASYAMLPEIHNTALRNQFAQIARNFLPFYFAQEQALKRAFKAMKDTSVLSPVFSKTIRAYQLSEQALNNPTFMETDSSGSKFIYIPGAGAFGAAVQSALNAYGFPLESGLPITAKGSMTSLKSVFPELTTPGVSPMLAISGNVLSSWFPATKGLVQGTIGSISYQRGLVDSVLPAAWFKNLIAATGVSGLDINNAYNNALAGALAAAEYHGQVPTASADATIKQAFIERIKNNARSILIAKSMLGLISPLAPQVSQEDVGLRDEFWKMYKDKNNNFADALLEFLGKHGNNAVSYTISNTDNVVPGAKYPYVQATLDYIKNNEQMFKDQNLSTGAYFLIPQDAGKGNDRTVYNEMVNMGLRSRRTPDELLKQFYIARGDADISADRILHTKTIADAKASMDTYNQKQENDRWKVVMSEMERMNPVWYKNYVNGDGKVNAVTGYTQLQNIFNGPNPPQHKQAQLVQGLMRDYQTHSQTLAQYKDLGIQGFLITDENQNWENHLLAVAQNQPELAPVINTIFKKLG